MKRPSSPISFLEDLSDLDHQKTLVVVDEPFQMEHTLASLHLSSSSSSSSHPQRPPSHPHPQRYDTLTWAKAHALPEPGQDSMLATGGLHPKSSSPPSSPFMDPPPPSSDLVLLSPATQPTSSPFLNSTCPSTSPSSPALSAQGSDPLQLHIPNIHLSNPSSSTTTTTPLLPPHPPSSPFLRLDMNYPPINLNNDSPTISLTTATPLTATPSQSVPQFDKVLQTIAVHQHHPLSDSSSSSSSPLAAPLSTTPPNPQSNPHSLELNPPYPSSFDPHHSSYSQNLADPPFYIPSDSHHHYHPLHQHPPWFHDHPSPFPSPQDQQEHHHLYPSYDSLLFDPARLIQSPPQFLTPLPFSDQQANMPNQPHYLNPRPVRSRQRSKSESLAKHGSLTCLLPNNSLFTSTTTSHPSPTDPPDSAPCSLWPSFLPNISDLPFSPSPALPSLDSPSSPCSAPRRPSSREPSHHEPAHRRSVGGPGYDTSFLSASTCLSPYQHRRSHSVSPQPPLGHRRGGSEPHLDFLDFSAPPTTGSSHGPTSRERSCSQSSHSEVSVSVSVSLSSKTTAATKAAAAKRRKDGSLARYVCDMCGETFTRRYNLRGHQRAHKGEKPFACGFPGCTSSFARAHDQKRHYKLHLGVKDYNCRACGKAFIRLDALQRHHKSDAGQACFFQLESSHNNLIPGAGSQVILHDHHQQLQQRQD